ncbi:hypothetical protein V3C99_009823, partial [Haemonchus contortus]
CVYVCMSMGASILVHEPAALSGEERRDGWLTAAECAHFVHPFYCCCEIITNIDHSNPENGGHQENDGNSIPTPEWDRTFRVGD